MYWLNIYSIVVKQLCFADYQPALKFINAVVLILMYFITVQWCS